MSSKKDTPMIRQYLSIKEKYKDTILLYRMGDFYEMFFEDAYLASKLLGIVLTSRNKKDSNSIPMCGFPCIGLNEYVSKLVAKGYKVAICDQIINQAKKSGELLDREVVQVITPGMVFDDTVLDRSINNFVLVLNKYKKSFGFSFLDVTTGDFFLTESNDINEVIDEILRIFPKEILLPISLKNDKVHILIKENISDILITFAEEDSFEYGKACQVLLEQFKILSLDGFGCKNMIAGVIASGVLLDYVFKTQKQRVEHIKYLRIHSLNDFLIVDNQSRINLELFKSIKFGSRKRTLIEIFDKTITAMGSRLLNNWLRYPLVDEDRIEERYNAIDKIINDVKTREDLRKILHSVYDLERINSKISVGKANARDMLALKQSLKSLPMFFNILSKLGEKSYIFSGDVDVLDDLALIIQRSILDDAPSIISEGGIIKKGFNFELDRLINVAKDSKKYLSILERKERKVTGIKNLNIKYSKQLGYYIEVSRKNKKPMPKYYFCKQTLSVTKRYIIDDLRRFEDKILSANVKRINLEIDIFNNIKKIVKDNSSHIQDVAKFIATVDCLICFATVAYDNEYTRPFLNSNGTIDIQDCRHPVVEKLVTDELFVSNSVKIDKNNNQILIITGPNMSGKSTILRQIALCVIIAHMGSFVPATMANINITDRIFTRVGALDNLAAGRSTFMVEMEETANILNNSTQNSLVIVDEIGRGTSITEALSIAWAVIEHLHDFSISSIFATHYHELANIDKDKSRVKNLNVVVKKDGEKIIFVRKLKSGYTKKSYGIEIARLAGMPKSVIRRANEKLQEINSNKTDLSSILEFKDENKPIKKINQSESKFLNLAKQRKLISDLRNIDLLNMTPIDALNFLNKLYKKAKDII